MKQAMNAYLSEDGSGRFYIFPQLCKGCGLCIERCPQQTLAFSARVGDLGVPLPEPGHNDAHCVACHSCELICPEAAIVIQAGGKG